MNSFCSSFSLNFTLFRWILPYQLCLEVSTLALCFFNSLFFIFKRDGFAFCEKDYQAEFGVTCAGCEGYITGKVLQVEKVVLYS